MSDPFNKDELERYARHFVLPEIGGPGQQKLKTAKVIVIGAGGLGAPALQYLAAAGIGQLTIVDADVVSLSNLQRQLIHDTAAVGLRKVESAAASIARLNPHVQVKTQPVRISKTNAVELLEGHTLALDGSDNFATRYLMADACEETQIPLITAAVHRFDGSITTLKPWEEGNPSYRDIFPHQPEEGLLPSCSEAGIMGAVTGILGTMQALEAIKEITGAGEGLVGRLLMVDGLSMRVETVRYQRAKK
ncbi:MAG: molybdopterin-synthase adenylyltransferase MoeB [Rhizobiaceae bacterium]